MSTAVAIARTSLDAEQVVPGHRAHDAHEGVVAGRDDAMQGAARVAGERFEARDLPVAILARCRRPLAFRDVNRRHVEQHHLQGRAHIGGDGGDLIRLAAEAFEDEPFRDQDDGLGSVEGAQALEHFAHAAQRELRLLALVIDDLAASCSTSISQRAASTVRQQRAAALAQDQRVAEADIAVLDGGDRFAQADVISGP